MKHRYYLHRENAPLCSSSVIYHVWVGESEREQKQLASLKDWAFRQGATLMLWSEDIAQYIYYESERVFPSQGLINFGFVTAKLTVSEAVKHAEADDWGLFEENLSTNTNYFSTIISVEPSKVNVAAGRIDNRQVLPESRINLSGAGSASPTIIRFI